MKYEYIYKNRTTLHLNCSNCGWKGLAASALIMIEGYAPSWAFVYEVDSKINLEIYCPICKKQIEEALNED